MLKKISILIFTAVTSALFLSSCLEETVADIARGQEVFENYCADCHDLGEEQDDKFYLGVTYHLQDLEEYIQSDMPYNSEEECDAQCAADVAAYIQAEMCEDGEDLTLCDEEGETGDQSIPNSDIGIKIAKGAVKFIYECSECHDITPDTVDGSARGANLFTANSTYFSEIGLKQYIETQMPPLPDLDPSSCDADCAEEVTLYLQSEFCVDTTTYAFCEGWDPSAY